MIMIQDMLSYMYIYASAILSFKLKDSSKCMPIPRTLIPNNLMTLTFDHSNMHASSFCLGNQMNEINFHSPERLKYLEG